MAFVVDQIHLDAAKAAVVFGVGRGIREHVLIANRIVNLGKDVGQRALEHGIKAQAAGHLGKGAHLIVGLQVVHPGDRTETAAGVSHLSDIGTGTDREDGDVRGRFDLCKHLVKRDLRERVATGADQDNVLATFDAANSVECFVKGVKAVGVGKAGNHKGSEGVADHLFVVREVRQDVGAQVVSNHRDVVVRPERAKKARGRVAHVGNVVIAGGSELKQHHGRDRGLRHAQAGNLLRHAILDNLEIAGFQAGNELVGFVEDDVDIKIDDGNIDPEGVGLVVRVLNPGFRRSWSGRFRGRLLLLQDDRAVVGLRTGIRISGRRWRLLSRLLRGSRGLLREQRRAQRNQAKQQTEWPQTAHTHDDQLYPVPP